MLAKRTQELNEQYQASRVQLSDNFKLELEKKDKVTIIPFILDGDWFIYLGHYCLCILSIE